MGLIILFFSCISAIYVKTFYADALCSGQILFADHIVTSDSSCVAQACTPFGGDYYTVTCPSSFFTLGLDQTTYAAPSAICTGAIEQVHTVPLTPVCSAGIKFACNASTVVQSNYGNPTCTGSPTSTNVIQVGVCVNGNIIKYMCNSGGMILGGLFGLLLMVVF